MPSSPEHQVSTPQRGYTYDALFDSKIWSKAIARFTELKAKDFLTPAEQDELGHLFAPIFRHYFDPI